MSSAQISLTLNNLGNSVKDSDVQVLLTCKSMLNGHSVSHNELFSSEQVSPSPPKGSRPHGTGYHSLYSLVRRCSWFPTLRTRRARCCSSKRCALPSLRMTKGGGGGGVCNSKLWSDVPDKTQINVTVYECNIVNLVTFKADTAAQVRALNRSWSHLKGLRLRAEATAIDRARRGGLAAEQETRNAAEAEA